MAYDKFKDAVHGLESIPTNAEVITPSDVTDLPHVCRRIHIGSDGNLDVTLKGGGRVVYIGLAAGQEKNGAFVKVWAAGTTATSLVAEW